MVSLIRAYMDIYIEILGQYIAFAGAAIVLLGVVITLVRFVIFLATGLSDERTARIRHSLMIYLSLGLDFLIAKDVIVTLSLERGDYESLIQLGIIIVIRILLSVFVHLEEKEIHLVRLKSMADALEAKKGRKK